MLPGLSSCAETTPATDRDSAFWVQNYGFYLRNRNFTALKVTIINYLQLK